ncbi:MAG TPA: hypothetical protein VHE30_25135 [Polyangiaceae bacterium]|nr:hypothetical protein [Polyangiaceae bacterium]
MTLTTSLRLVFVLTVAAATVGACSSSDDGSGNAPQTSANCGNGTLDTGEACDGINLNGATCASLNSAKPNGTPTCNNCVLSDSTCSSGTGNGGSGSGGKSSSGGSIGTGGGPSGSGGRSNKDAG